MAALGQGVDALSIATPVLKSGPSAYETTIARMGIEGDNAKLAAAKDAEKAKEKAARGKAFEMDLGTVELPDTIAWNKRMADEQATYAEELQAFEEGKGEDPDDPRSLAGQKRMARLQGHKQYASNSKQKMAYGNTLLGLIRANKHAYADGAEEATLAWMSDPSVNDTGELIDPAEQYYNLDADLKATLGDLAASGYEKAQRDANGDVLTTGGEYIIPEDVLGGVKLVLQKPAASKEALRRFEALAQRDPKAAEQIAAVAKKNNIPAEAAMIWNEAAKVYGYSKSTQSLAQQSEGGAGRRDVEEGLNWLAEWRKGAEEGKYEGNDATNLFGISPVSGTKLPENYKTLKGWVFDQTEVYDQGEGKNIKKESVIESINVDRDKEKWVIKLDTGELREIPFEKFESEVIPRLGAYNKEKISGIGGYLNAAKKSGYFQDIKGTGAEEMVKTGNKKSAYSTTGKKKAY